MSLDSKISILLSQLKNNPELQSKNTTAARLNEVTVPNEPLFAGIISNMPLVGAASLINESIPRFAKNSKAEAIFSISSSPTFSRISSCTGVADATFVKVFQKTGSGYSTVNFNVDNYTTSDGRFIKAPKNVIFEVKFPNSDIEGTIR